MGSFKRALFGYRPSDVDAAILSRETQIVQLKEELDGLPELETRLSKKEAELAETGAEFESLSGMVIEREREIRGLGERLREVHERHERSIASLESVSARLEEIEKQARGQATRIRMKALREAVEVSKRSQELADAESAVGVNGNGHGEAAAESLFEGLVKVEIGPLGDFSQLVGFEDAIGEVGASEISVERFSEGRATLSMNLDEPVDLLRELEERSPLEFHVRRTADDNLILDVDDDQGPEQHAA